MKWKDSMLLQCLNKYLAIENLVGTDFIFGVKAENRNGDIIAKSRGIKSAYSEWF